jgi:hypothetical protein
MERRSRVKKETGGARNRISHERAVLDEFIAACLDHAQQQLIGEGAAAGTIHFGYGLNGEGSEPAIRHYALTRQDTDKAAQELGEIRAYAAKTGAEAVSIAMDLGAVAETRDFFPSCDGVLLVAAVSHHGRVGVMRPYKRSGDRVELGEPRIVDPFEAPFLQGLFGTAA